MSVEVTLRCLCEAGQRVVGHPGIGVGSRGPDLGVMGTEVLVLSQIC